MARHTASSTPSHVRASPPPPARGRPGRAHRRVRRAAIAGFVAGVAWAGISALPSPGIQRTAWEPAPANLVTGTVAPRYDASPLHRWLMGGGYRDLWAQPIQAPALDPRALRPLRTGGGRQTRGLRLRGADGREYAFRSIDKDQSKALDPLPRLLMGRFRQDQVSALHPGAALIASGLQDVAGVVHAPARLGVMPSTPALGRFRAEFGDLPGTWQEYPRHGFLTADRVVETDSLWEELRRRPGDRVNDRGYLRARLMDVYMGDWDRHEGQLMWARFNSRGAALWTVIPRDRDYAFSDYRGVIPGLARRVDPKIVRFDTAYRDLHGLLVKSRELDLRLLCGVPAAAWDSTAAELVSLLDDQAITAAMFRLPMDWVSRSARLEATLRARRDRLPQAARRFRQHLHANGGCQPRR